MLSASKSGSGLSTGYNLTRSLRFRASASAYLNRTPASAGNRKTWTWSAWVKRGKLGSNQVLFISKPYATSDATFTEIAFTSSDTLVFSGYSVQWRNTTQVFRDPSSWYHIVVTWDTTQATASNRVKIYVNGLQVTAFGTTFDPSLNFDGAINQADAHFFCYLDGYSSSYFDGYLTEVNFIDGQALTPSSFGSTNALTGVWQPARYTGTYGTNGFYLPFTDNSALTTSSNVGLGKDFSGNGNYWVTNNISITTGTTYDSMTDVPTLTSATASNFAVINPIMTPQYAQTYSDGNLKCVGNYAYVNAQSTIAVPSGQWYAEAVFTPKVSALLAIGINNKAISNQIGRAGENGSVGYWTDAIKTVNGVATSYGATYGSNDVIGVAMDITGGTVTFYKNGVSQGSISYTFSGSYGFLTGGGSTFGAGDTVVWNFGQRPFSYTPPTGYVALNTYNLPTSTILQGNKVMDATLYTGNGGTQAVVNAGGFKPDLVWLKSRSAAYDHLLFDSIRGTGKALFSSSTAAETTTNNMSAFNSNGFTALYDSTYIGSNNSGVTMVGWQWQAGQGSTSSNTNGSITSTVSVNASAGFSVVTFSTSAVYTGGTVGHGLGVAPAMYIVKNRNGVANINWLTYHQSVGNTAALYLNGTNAATTSSTFWNNTSPTSSVFSIGANLYISSDMVAYCWTPIAGYSAFGSLTGNGSADGPFVYVGFRPKLILFKNASAVASWWIYDTVRNTYNVADLGLRPNTSDAETSFPTFDILSNGFKVRTSDSGLNGSGNTIVYACWAENPFKNALAR